MVRARAARGISGILKGRTVHMVRPVSSKNVCFS